MLSECSITQRMPKEGMLCRMFLIPCGEYVTMWNKSCGWPIKPRYMAAFVFLDFKMQRYAVRTEHGELRTEQIRHFIAITPSLIFFNLFFALFMGDD